jgi:ribonuclease J|tara:strand:+ start:14982 stop:16643 length:1662 start_codon:yes stop_codon:yes gene_type:complete
LETPNVNITFLGGLGEVGRNCTCIEIDGKLLLIDFGVMFPDATMPGVDVILPDTQWLAERGADIVGLLITHGHEDHVGGVVHLLREFEVPLYGSALTMGLARRKVTEARLEDRTSFQILNDGERRRIGPFDVEVLPITHSIPQSLCVVLHTDHGVMVHTGDFKLDSHPIDGRITDLKRLEELQEDPGVRVLMADSTNADKPGWSASESTMRETFERRFPEWTGGRLVVSCFASHLHRVQQICDVAIKEGRTIFPLGRSMVNNIRIAQELGVLDLPHRCVDSIEHLHMYEPGDVCVICTGSQGEPNAALSLIARSEHPDLSLGAGDVVMLSSHPIPGNEISVYRVIDQLTRLGCEVVHDGQEHVHTSGHAQRDELRHLYDIVRPEWYVPIEGEYRMLQRNADVAVEAGHQPDRSVVVLDGTQLTLDEKGLRVTGHVPAPYRFVDGLLDDLGPDMLEARRRLSEGGFVHVTVVVSNKTGLVGHPEISTQGWIDTDKSVVVLAELEIEVAQAVRTSISEGKRLEDLDRVVRRITGRFVGNRTRRRPPISASVITVD